MTVHKYKGDLTMRDRDAHPAPPGTEKGTFPAVFAAALPRIKKSYD
jgi:hypothetical protein